MSAELYFESGTDGARLGIKMEITAIVARTMKGRNRLAVTLLIVLKFQINKISNLFNSIVKLQEKTRLSAMLTIKNNYNVNKIKISTLETRQIQKNARNNV